MNTISSIHQLYLTKQSSIQDIVTSYLNRIDQYDSQINSFITICNESALTTAKQQDEQFAPEMLQSKPLYGIPIALKDIYLTKDIRTTASSNILSNYIPQYSSTVWNKLQQAGAILIGKLNCDAWAHGSSGENSDFGPTKNPWNLDYVPGGSSSGSGASVASGFVPVSMGTDTGGSVRLPASFCNLVGLKPTYGRVSRYGVIAMASSLDTMGHITHTVEDSARILSITAGIDPFDATTNPQSPIVYHQNLKLPNKQISIGIPKEYFENGLDLQISQALQNVQSIFQNKLNFKLVPVSLPHTKYGISVYYIIMPSEVSSNLGRYDGIRFGNTRDNFGQEAQRRIMLGTYVLSAGHQDAYYKKAQQLRTLIKQDFEESFTKVDLLLAPVSPTPPFKIGDKNNNPLQMYLSDILTVNINLAGLPSISIPCGFTSDNLPMGFQLIGPQFQEQVLFQVGHAYQQITDFHLQTPTLKSI